jgi:PBP1b-binding outer membrane lipoprotein LpoB
MSFAVVAVALLLMGCVGDDGQNAGAQPAALNGPTSSVDFTDVVQQVLAIDANAEPVDINNLMIDNQFAGGESLPVATFLP